MAKTRSSTSVKISKGKVLGLSRKLEWPSNVVVPEEILAVEMENRIYVVGFEEPNFTDILVYDKSSGIHLQSLELPSEEGGSTGEQHFDGNYFVDLTVDEKGSKVYLFWIREPIVRLVSIDDGERPIVHDLFSNSPR